MSKKLLIPVILVVLVGLIGGGYFVYNQFLSPTYNYPMVEQKFAFDEPKETDVMTMMKKETPTKTLSSSVTTNSSLPTIAPKLPIPERKYAQFIPKFSEVEIPFVHKYSDQSVQFTGGSLIDVNNDGVDEIFICGGKNQADGLMYFENNKFVDKIEGTELSSQINCYGSFVADTNNDKFSDILVAREDGVYQYINNKSGKFVGSKININFEANTVPVNISGGDIDNDGILDLYISTFPTAAFLKNTQFNNDSHARANILLSGKPDGTYQDITQSSGAFYDENTFITSFVDLNNDGLQDIVIAPDTSRMVIFKNNGNKQFTKLEPLSDNGFWMGLGLGDVDNDGDIDIFATNVGNTISTNFLRGDLRSDEVLDPKWRLLRNDGNFKFTDITAQSKLDNYEFAWGALFEDFNLDGVLDLSVMESYIKWPAHTLNKLPGRFFVGTKSGVFQPTTKDSGVENFAYGMTPLTSDFNKDGYPDLINLNLNGKTKAFINNGGENKSITIELPTSAKYIDAKITTTLDDDKTIYRQYAPSQGLSASQSNKIIIPLAKDHNVSKIVIKLSNGETQTIETPKLGEVVKVK
jgi:enediyne biosynthesis protein E4